MWKCLPQYGVFAPEREPLRKVMGERLRGVCIVILMFKIKGLYPREPEDNLPANEVRASDNEGPLKIGRTEMAIFLDTQLGGFGDAVKAQIVLRRIDFGQ